MSGMIDRVAEAIEAQMRTSDNYPEDLARAAIEAMRELPDEPGPRYTDGEYSRRNQTAMVDDALGLPRSP